jgi:hypothetical protein
MLGPRIPYHSTYRLVEAFRHISTYDVQETLHEQVLAFHFLGAEHDELAFSVQQMENQTTFFPENLAPRLALDQIFDKLLVATDLTGRIQRVLNASEITSRWQTLKTDLTRQTTAVAARLIYEVDRQLQHPGGLENLVRNSKYGLLLADLSGVNPAQAQAVGKQQVDYFLEGHQLPLFTSSAFSTGPDEAAAYTLATVGMLNTDEFNHKSFARWLKKKVDMYDLKVAVDVDFEQRHVLNRHQQVTQAEQFVAAEVAGCYSQSRARTLTLLA